MPETRLTEVRDPETRRALGEALVARLDEWGLHEVNQAALVGVRDIAALRRGAPLPTDPEVLERAGHLLAIGRALYRAYPYQPRHRARWVSASHGRLHGSSPLQYMLAAGVNGIRRVRTLAEAEARGYSGA